MSSPQLLQTEFQFQYGIVLQSQWIQSQSLDNTQSLLKEVLSSDLNAITESSLLHKQQLVTTSKLHIDQSHLFELLWCSDTNQLPTPLITDIKQSLKYGNGKHRMLHLYLSDGINIYNAMELEHIDALNNLLIGNKLLVNKFYVKRGMILLCNCNVVLLGGSTPDNNVKLKQLQSLSPAQTVPMANGASTDTRNNQSVTTQQLLMQSVTAPIPSNPHIPNNQLQQSIQLQPQSTTQPAPITSSPPRNPYVSMSTHNSNTVQSSDQMFNNQRHHPSTVPINTLSYDTTTPASLTATTQSTSDDILSIDPTPSSLQPNRSEISTPDSDMLEQLDNPWLRDDNTTIHITQKLTPNKSTNQSSMQSSNNPSHPASAAKRIVNKTLDEWISPSKSMNNTTAASHSIATTQLFIPVTKHQSHHIIPTTNQPAGYTPVSAAAVYSNTPVNRSVEIIDLDSPVKKEPAHSIKQEQPPRNLFSIEFDSSMNSADSVDQTYISVTDALVMSTRMLKSETVHVLVWYSITHIHHNIMHRIHCSNIY